MPNIKERIAAGRAKRGAKQTDRQVNKFKKQIIAGTLDVDQLPPGMVTAEMKRAQGLANSQNYSDRMKGDSETQRMRTAKELEGMGNQKNGGKSPKKAAVKSYAKGGVSAKKKTAVKSKAFFSPASAKPKKKK